MSTSFSQALEVLEGARAAMKVGAVSSGERVGFICDLRVEADVIYAFFAAAKEIGATPFLCMVERGTGYGPPDEFLETIKTADVLYFSWEMANSLPIKALRKERGTRCVGFPHCRTAALLADDAVRFPLDVLSALYPKTWDVFRTGKDVEVRITDPKGTDFRVVLTNENIADKFPKDPRYAGHIVANKPGYVSHLPVGHGPNVLSPSEPHNETSEGVVRLDAVTLAQGVYRGWSGDAAYQEPVTCHIQAGKIVEVEGGREAEVFRRVVGRDLAKVCQLREIGLGHNPKVPTYRGERGYHGANHAGAVHWGFGGGPEKKRIHIDAIIFQSTILANGVPIVERGRLKALDDPEVRELASKYGDPDRVLAEAL
jgi:hypothetical protein